MEKFHFGKNLQKIREEKGGNQFKMAVDLGMAQSTLSKIDNDPSVPKSEFVDKAAAYLDVPREMLLPEAWTVKLKKRTVYALTKVGFTLYAIAMFSLCLSIITEVVDLAQKPLLIKVCIAALVFLVGFAFCFFTTKKVEITEY